MFVTTFNICMIHIRNEDFTVGSRTYSVIAIWELLTFFYKGWVTFIPLFRIKTTTGVPGPGVVYRIEISNNNKLKLNFDINEI